jgi:hypothetical protein
MEEKSALFKEISYLSVSALAKAGIDPPDTGYLLGLGSDPSPRS